MTVQHDDGYQLEWKELIFAVKRFREAHNNYNAKDSEEVTRRKEKENEEQRNQVVKATPLIIKWMLDSDSWEKRKKFSGEKREVSALDAINLESNIVNKAFNNCLTKIIGSKVGKDIVQLPIIKLTEKGLVGFYRPNGRDLICYLPDDIYELDFESDRDHEVLENILKQGVGEKWEDFLKNYSIVREQAVNNYFYLSGWKTLPGSLDTVSGVSAAQNSRT